MLCFTQQHVRITVNGFHGTAEINFKFYLQAPGFISHSFLRPMLGLWHKSYNDHGYLCMAITTWCQDFLLLSHAPNNPFLEPFLTSLFHQYHYVQFSTVCHLIDYIMTLLLIFVIIFLVSIFKTCNFKICQAKLALLPNSTHSE